MLKNKISALASLILLVPCLSQSQNLIVNPGAEAAPAATGWTVQRAGVACTSPTAANTFSVWTMTPNASADYPAAHGGTKTFFAGCTPTPPGSYELNQTISVASDAAQIDVGNVELVFSGYIQTPVNTQNDAGRFTIDFLDGSNAVLGTSYSVVQSNAAGSGTGWNFYTNTRTAPLGTRSVRVRLIASVVQQPAISAYFDDISLVKNFIVPLPVKLVSFSAKHLSSVILKWQVSDAVNFEGFDLERSDNLVDFNSIAMIAYNGNSTAYSFEDRSAPANTRILYRLKMKDRDGKYTYSPIVTVNANNSPDFTIKPNPASSIVSMSGFTDPGELVILSTAGAKVASYNVTTSELSIDVSKLSKGIYIVQFRHRGILNTRKLIIR